MGKVNRSLTDKPPLRPSNAVAIGMPLSDWPNHIAISMSYCEQNLWGESCDLRKATKMSLVQQFYYIFVYPGLRLIFIRIFRDMPLFYPKRERDHNRLCA